MFAKGRVVSQFAFLAAMAALPCVLLFSSLRTLRELNEQKEVFLRERVAEIAGRLEIATGGMDPTLPILEAEPSLRDLRIIERNGAPGDQDQAILQPIWGGQQLFHTETINSGTGRIYRAYVPFHSPQGVRIAQIDLDGNAADFLLVHARHNVFISILGGLALILLSFYAVWMARRSAALERRQVDLEHLARVGRLAAVLAHEIRNPLGTIKGFTQLALERVDKSTRDLLDPVLCETERLERLVNDLLTYGRPPKPSKRAVFWPEVAGELEQHARTLAGERRIEFMIAREPIRFTTDPDLLRQILLNALRNAIDAVAEEPAAEVKISVLMSRGQIAIVVSDNGPGVCADTAARVFEPFFSTKVFGTGLGLAISAQLAKVLGARLELRNRIPHGVEVGLTLLDANPFREQTAAAAYGTDTGSR